MLQTIEDKFQPMFSSIQIHTGIAEGKTATLFTVPENGNNTQLTTGTAAQYQMLDYHTNMKQFGTLNDQVLIIPGFKIWADVTDRRILEDLFINSWPLFQLFKGGGNEELFRAPLYEMVRFANGSASSFGVLDTTVKGQKWNSLLMDKDYYKLPEGKDARGVNMQRAIEIGRNTNFKAVITFRKAVTFYKTGLDYGAMAADAAYTTPFHLFCSLQNTELKVQER